VANCVARKTLKTEEIGVSVRFRRGSHVDGTTAVYLFQRSEVEQR